MTRGLRMDDTHAWLIRAGSGGEFEQFNLDEGLATLGWGELGDLSNLTRPEITQRLEMQFPEASPGAIRNWTGQVWSFANAVSVGDLVVLPSKGRPMIAIGRVTGGYRHRPDLPEGAAQTISVDWTAKDVPRTAIGQDLLYSLGSLLTVCRLARNNAAVRLAALAQNGIDPGNESPVEPGPGISVTAAEAAADGAETASDLDLERIARDEINKRISARFPGHELSELVAAVLHASGMTTYVAPSGKDGGIDVLAGSGPLGMDRPRICVQVKFTKDPVSAMVVRELQGVMARVDADQALLVSWSGVTRDAERELRQEFFRVRVWNADDLFEQITAVYSRLPEEIQAKLPLKRIWTIAAEQD